MVEGLAVFVHEQHTREQVVTPEASERNLHIKISILISTYVCDPPDRGGNKVVPVEGEDSESLLFRHSDHVELSVVGHAYVADLKTLVLLAVAFNSEIDEGARIALLSVHVKLFVASQSKEYILVSQSLEAENLCYG